MPESYLHVRCARKASQMSGVPKYDLPATVAGAAGPDILFYYLGLPTLARLGGRMHRERCGPFLTALIRGADSDVKKGYVLGFLSHNATDATLHPWISADREVHALLEQRIDSLYLLRDKGRALPLPGDCMARLRPDKGLEIGALLSRCVREVYGAQVSAGAFAKSFRDFYRCKGWLKDATGRKGRVAGRAERALKLTPGMISGHLLTGDPFEGADELDALVHRAEALGAELMAAAVSWWSGELGPLELARQIGSRDYLTGENA